MHQHCRLKDHPEKLLSYCLDVVDAMVYLEAKTFIHRDLAARNILMDKEHHCKVKGDPLTYHIAGNFISIILGEYISKWYWRKLNLVN